ncbi:AAA family ATPase [Desulfoplanes sp. PS50]
MLLQKISLQNFRCFDELTLEFRDRLNLFLGDNGSGKSTILDAIAVGLGTVATYLPDVAGVSFKDDDVKVEGGSKAPFVRVAVETRSGVCWDITKRRDKSKKTARLVPQGIGKKQVTGYLDTRVIDPYNESKDFILPFFAYYGVSRAILDIPLRRRGFSRRTSRFQALAGALNADSRFKSAFVWFYNKENEESRLQKEKRSFDVTLPELDVVRRALSSLFPDLSEPHIQIHPLRFMVKKGGQLLSLHQLSDGYKTMLGLILDLSSRMAMANPDVDDPLACEALVMIDEVDLHLHPTWQQRVLGDLLKIFPKTQFILTTHSPFIVESLNNHLKRHTIARHEIHDPIVTDIKPLPAERVSAFLLANGETHDIMDRNLGLVDDRLIAHFNEINILYDRMRDIEWEAAHD